MRRTGGKLAMGVLVGLVALPGNASDVPAAGDPARGRAIVADRQLGLCLLCHRVPIPEARFQGEIGPDLAGVGTRRSADELRLRLIDPTSFNPDTPMPSFTRRAGQWRVPPALRGRPILTDEQVEDVVAYLGTLR